MSYNIKHIHSHKKGNVVTIYLPNFCLNQLSKETTVQIIDILERVNKDDHVNMVVFRTVQENFFLPKFSLEEAPIISDSIMNSDYFINLKDMIHSMRAMTVSVIEGATNKIGSSFIKASDLSYATESTVFSNGMNIDGNQLFTAEKAEENGIITRMIPEDKIDLTLDYLGHTYESE
ncbi:hypothetical protein KMW28_19500 [Flammeovirga yaeyamensis]|uniref:Uncharacterized protein n=1 Tax=Flammeovirga yaeyamensis TaxID=367791 RepID=A0AAX1N7C9_9BACT|nr:MULTISPECIES: hypothetical protein [Flammeovirga]ANQ50805.2 hypothetical protein MY04_3452 [Flammeovirga sp. MY04]MBB3700810.1 enoyl-CoA hydratase/carnithine racemase [Flammeovirga yaeyamensis]NMF37835.1 hypothetical protein [Flammeovirga yaeyamensis]QWG01803.1 hypothetical protein KMW28_19500 [Flammeovirga yaeyamensis]